MMRDCDSFHSIAAFMVGAGRCVLLGVSALGRTEVITSCLLLIGFACRPFEPVFLVVFLKEGDLSR